MKRLVLLTLALLVVAMPAMAQVAPFGGMPDYYRQGKIMVAAALDTFHFEDTQVAEVADWQGYETVYVPNGSNGLDTERAYVVAAVLYADSPFRYSAISRNGDIGGTVVQALVDTVGGAESPNRGDAATAGAVYLTTTYPCWTIVRGDLDEIRATPTTSDTLFCVPLMDYKMD